MPAGHYTNRYFIICVSVVNGTGNKIKLFLVSPMPPPAGGIQTITEALISYFSTSADNFDIVLYDTTHHIRPATSQAMGIRIITGIDNSLRTYFAVRKVIRRSKPDLVHLSSSSGFSLIKDLMIIRFANRRNIPVVMHWHFGRIPDIIRRNNWEWKLLSKVVRSSSGSIVLDTFSFDALSGLNFRNIHMIPNPLPYAVEKKALELISERDHFNEERRNTGRVIFVGHMIKEKGIYDLAEACSKINCVKELVFVGNYLPPVCTELRKRASGRAESWLRITGEMPHDKVLELMSQSAILALPSYTEGFPMVIIEAMAMGCAVVATDVGAIPEMLAIPTGHPCGICIPAHNVEKLGIAISNLCEDPKQTRIMGQNGINRVMEYYSLRNVLEQYKVVWNSASARA
jgi:glycosyltransferase involved in cell wall biosynthesis